MSNPLTFLREAVRAVPAVRYALGVGGIVATIAIVFSFKIDPKVAFVGTVVMLLLMVVLVVFARIVSLAGPRTLLPALVLTWFAILIFIAVSLSLFSSVFFKKPLDLAYWLTGTVIQPPAPVFDEVKALAAIELGADLQFVLDSLGQPKSTSVEPGGFRLSKYSFPRYDLTIVYDRSRKIMQYGIYIKRSEFRPEIALLQGIIGRKVRVGEHPFGAISADILNPMYLSPLSSDEEPFRYYELLSETPETDVAIRLEYIVPRRDLPTSSITSAEVFEKLAVAIHALGCSYGLQPEGKGVFTKAEFNALEKWRSTVSPNAFTVQRRLEDDEVKPFTEHIAAYRLCEKE